mmetsp:Transcript_757/g.960  ORF Transcript_757/g.960 Transcript_757/m.960 type:complete len:163 (-) Transcript_757:348-836(-)
MQAKTNSLQQHRPCTNQHIDSTLRNGPSSDKHIDFLGKNDKGLQPRLVLAKLEKMLWGILIALFLSIIVLVIVASSGAPVMALMICAVLSGMLSVAFSCVANSIAAHKEKYEIVDDNSSQTTSKSETKTEMKAVKIDPQNPSVIEIKQKIDVVALDGTNEVV